MPRNLRRSRVLRTITNDSNVDKALREIYDRLDDLQPEKVEKASPLYNKKAPIGSTMIVKNTLGDESIAIKTDSGWKVDINSKYVSTNNNNFNPSKGTKSIKGEALLYDASSNLFASAELNINRIPQVTTDTNKFLVSDGGTIKYVTGDNLLTYLGISSGEIIDWTVDQGGTDIHSGNYSDTNTTYTGGTNLTLSGTEFNVDDAFITNNAADVMTVSDFGANAALKIDADQPATAGAEDSIGLHIDYDRAVATSGTGAHNDIGIDLDVNTATLGSGTARGMDIDVVGATSGNHIVKGIDIRVSGADKNHGLDITAPNGAYDYHIKLISADDPIGDYATFSVADTGDMTIATTGNGTTDSDLTLDVDGGLYIDVASGAARISTNSGTYTPSATSSITTKAYVDAKRFAMTTNGQAARMGSVNTWYISNQSFGTGIAAADWSTSKFNYSLYNSYSPVKLKSWRVVAEVSSSVDYEWELWDIAIPADGTAAIATAAKVGDTQSVSPTAYRIYTIGQTDLDYGVAEGHALYLLRRYTSGSGTKYTYESATLEFEVA